MTIEYDTDKVTNLEYKLIDANDYIIELKEEIRMLERELRAAYRELDKANNLGNYRC